MKRLMFLFTALVVALAAGCATRNPDEESDIPWNSPQPWEGAPGIPGLESR
jgi:hypothetical protein